VIPGVDGAPSAVEVGSEDGMFVNTNWCMDMMSDNWNVGSAWALQTGLFGFGIFGMLEL
jgi:hypothetical protein